MVKKVTITIDCDNAAFGDTPEFEIGRILRELATKFLNGRPPQFIRDSNGNTVGACKIGGKV